MSKSKKDTSSSVKYAPLLWRVFAFGSIFVVFSGLIGPRIVGGGMLYRYHFDIYGGLGKALLFGLVAFGLLVRKKHTTPKIIPWEMYNAVYLALSILFFTLSWHYISQLLAGADSAVVASLAHFNLLVSLLLALCGCFGLANLRLIWQAYRRQLIMAASIAAGFYVFLLAVYGLWEVLAAAVLHGVRWLLGLVGLKAAVVPPRTLLLDKFGINIAQYCSGIESIALFSGLYAVVGLLDWQRFNKQRFLWLFPVGLLILFGFNVLRVFLLILAGYYINPHIAFSLFHTYAGMIFFIIYAAIFWSLTYKWMLAKPTRQAHHPHAAGGQSLF